MAGYLKETLSWLASRAARPYSAPSVEDARRICLDLGRSGFGSTVCFWNAEADRAPEIVRAYLTLLDLLKALDSHSYLSIKLPAMRFDPDAVSTVLERAAKAGRLVHFDSHGQEDADGTFRMIQSGFQYNPRIGCTIPGRWRRSIEDARIAADCGLRVRVVKGQWADPAQPDMDMRRGFLNVIDRLAGRGCFVAVASHDIPLAEESLRRLLSAGTPCELELLYGLPRRGPIKLARKLGVSVRFYVPQGTAWLPYLLKQARNNPYVLAWFARDFLRGYVS